MYMAHALQNLFWVSELYLLPNSWKCSKASISLLGAQGSLTTTLKSWCLLLPRRRLSVATRRGGHPSRGRWGEKRGSEQTNRRQNRFRNKRSVREKAIPPNNERGSIPDDKDTAGEIRESYQTNPRQNRTINKQSVEQKCPTLPDDGCMNTTRVIKHMKRLRNVRGRKKKRRNKIQRKEENN